MTGLYQKHINWHVVLVRKEGLYQNVGLPFQPISLDYCLHIWDHKFPASPTVVIKTAFLHRWKRPNTSLTILGWGSFKAV